MATTLKATGYDPNEYFFATRYQQGGRTVYSLDFSVRELVTFLPKPDPDKPLDVNATQRRITPIHARDFGTYVLTDKEWVSPALLLRAPDIFGFEDALPDLDTGSTKFGQLAVPKDARSEISLVDGQHRTLGFHLAWEMLNEDIAKARASLAQAKQIEDAGLVQHHQKELNRLLARREQLSAERVSVQIVVVDTPDVARRIFVDINDNAKGITGAVKSRFDDRKVISRALNRVLATNDLLDGRVDLEQDRVSGSSKYLLGAKHVADMLRAITVGHGRISKRLEAELSDQKIAANFDDFIAALMEAFPALGEVESEDLSPAELRSQSLIGSNVMLRGFAAAWFELKEAEWTEEDITKAWATFEPQMSAPVYTDPRDTWYASGLFPATIDGAYSPTSRVQDFKALSGFIGDLTEESETVEWFRATKTDSKAAAQGA